MHATPRRWSHPLAAPTLLALGLGLAACSDGAPDASAADVDAEAERLREMNAMVDRLYDEKVDREATRAEVRAIRESFAEAHDAQLAAAADASAELSDDDRRMELLSAWAELDRQASRLLPPAMLDVAAQDAAILAGEAGVAVGRFARVDTVRVGASPAALYLYEIEGPNSAVFAWLDAVESQEVALAVWLVDLPASGASSVAVAVPSYADAASPVPMAALRGEALVRMHASVTGTAAANGAALASLDAMASVTDTVTRLGNAAGPIRFDAIELARDDAAATGRLTLRVTGPSPDAIDAYADALRHTGVADVTTQHDGLAGSGDYHATISGSF